MKTINSNSVDSTIDSLIELAASALIDSIIELAQTRGTADPPIQNLISLAAQLDAALAGESK